MGGLRLKVKVLLLIGCEYSDDGSVDPRFWRATGGGSNVPIRVEFCHDWRRGRSTVGRMRLLAVWASGKLPSRSRWTKEANEVKPPEIERDERGWRLFILCYGKSVIAPMGGLGSGFYVSPLFLFITLILPPPAFSRNETLFAEVDQVTLGYRGAIK